MKILIIGPAWVGDMVMAQSLFKAIKTQAGSAQAKYSNKTGTPQDVLIDVLAPDWSRPLLERMPEVHRAIPISLQHGELKLKSRYEVAQRLKENQYQQSIVLTNSWKSALIPWLAKIPTRTGWLGEMRWGLLNDIRTFDKKEFPLMVQRFVMLAYPKNTALLEFVSHIQPPKLETQYANVTEALSKFGVTPSDKPILALCPGAEFGSSKRWPEEYYAEIAKQKLKEGWSVWLFGSKKDVPVAEKIQAQTEQQCVDFTGKTSLGEAIDLLSLVTEVISNDSGLMHIASALEKPLLAVYGSTDPNFTPPLSAKAQIARLSGLACSPCFKRECPLTDHQHHKCMKDLTPEIILSKLKTLEKSCGF